MRRLIPALTLSSLLIGLPVAGVTLVGLSSSGALAQAIDMSHGEQVHISSAGPQTYDHDAQTVTFVDQARAVRGDVTIDADQLIGFLRKKAPDPNAPPPPQGDSKADNGKGDGDGAMGGSMELYRMEAIGHVHIYTSTDQAWGDKALYDIDQAVLVMTGKALKLTTPQDVMTARDVMEYHANTRMSVGRGDATVTTNDGKRIKLMFWSLSANRITPDLLRRKLPPAAMARRSVRPNLIVPMPGAMSCCEHPTKQQQVTGAFMYLTHRWHGSSAMCMLQVARTRITAPQPS